MNLVNRLIERFFPNFTPLPAGVYHYQAPPNAEFPYRLHLRIDPDGKGILILNASTILHLNQSAAEFAYHMIRQTPPEEVLKWVVKRYRVPEKQALNDFQDFKERLETLIVTPDLDPVTYLGFDREDPYLNPSAPYRIDCALTYRTYLYGEKNFAPTDRVNRELITGEWQTILKKAWEAGIPHVVFTGGEPTLRPDLPELIAIAEDLGMVTGVLTNGLRLTEKDYLHTLLKNGLDHMMILLDPQDDQSWEAILDTLVEDISLTVHLTINKSMLHKTQKCLKRMKEMGVTNLSLSVESKELKEELSEAQKNAAALGLTLVWDLPVPYSAFHPIALELEEAGEPPHGAGKAWIYVEPDGDVLPAQGVTQCMGNLLNDPWEKIWSPGG